MAGKKGEFEKGKVLELKKGQNGWDELFKLHPSSIRVKRVCDNPNLKNLMDRHEIKKVEIVPTLSSTALHHMMIYLDD